MALVAPSTPIGRTFQTPVGSFVRYQLDERSLNRGKAIARARSLARRDGRRVVDVVAAVEQPHGEWIVELQVRA